MQKVNDSMVTIGIYFEVHDSEVYGGNGTLGYANINSDSKVSDIAKADIEKYADSMRQSVADMCKVDKEKVIIISRRDYEKETEYEYDDDEYDDWDE